LRDSNPRPSAC